MFLIKFRMFSCLLVRGVCRFSTARSPASPRYGGIPPVLAMSGAQGTPDVSEPTADCKVLLSETFDLRRNRLGTTSNRHCAAISKEMSSPSPTTNLFFFFKIRLSRLIINIRRKQVNAPEMQYN